MVTSFSIEGVFDTWTMLMAQQELSEEEGEPLLEDCETFILTHPIHDHAGAARLCAVLSSGFRDGPRSDGLDIDAMTRLQEWLQQRASKDA